METCAQRPRALRRSSIQGLLPREDGQGDVTETWVSQGPPLAPVPCDFLVGSPGLFLCQSI